MFAQEKVWLIDVWLVVEQAWGNQVCLVYCRPLITPALKICSRSHTRAVCRLSIGRPCQPTLTEQGLGGASSGTLFRWTPAVVIGSNTPAILHSKGLTLVTAANPAHRRRDSQTLFALYAGEYAPNLPSLQVNFTLPPETQAGMASVQLSAAWMAGDEIPVR